MPILSQVILEGLYSTIPSAAAVGAGCLFFATDTGRTWYSNGTTWVDVTPTTPSGAANEVYATPNGSSGAAGLRALVPADLPVATTSALGAVKPDGSTVTISAGVISASAGSGLGTFTVEDVVFSGTSGALSHTPSTLLGIFRNGAIMSQTSGAPAVQKFSISGAAVTLSVAAGSGDWFYAVYFHS